MGKIKWVYDSLNGLFISIWGLTIIDLIPFLKPDIFSSFDGIIKTFMAFAGLVYFVITIPHKIKMQKLARKQKQLEIKDLEKDVNK